MTKAPSVDDLSTAAEWLRANEGPDGEDQRCARVADWIEQEASNQFLRSEARRAGIPVAVLRKRIKENAT